MVKKVLLAVGVLVVLFLVVKLFSQEYYTSDIVSGDVNMDGRICMDDSIQIIYHLWRDGRELPCPDTADVDRSGVIDVNDVLTGLQHIFFGFQIPDCPVNCYSD